MTGKCPVGFVFSSSYFCQREVDSNFIIFNGIIFNNVLAFVFDNSCCNFVNVIAVELYGIFNNDTVLFNKNTPTSKPSACYTSF